MKHPEFDIILSTQLPIDDKEIIDLCDFIIFDKQDIKSWVNYNVEFIGNFWWSRLQNAYFEIKFDNAYHYDIYRLIYFSNVLASSLNYEFFYYVEGDCELNQENIEDFLTLKNETLNNNKNMVLFKRESNPDRVSDGFEDEHFATVIFGGIPKYFIEKLKLPLTPEEWVKDHILTGFAFEYFFYLKFKHLIDEFSVYDMTIQNKVKEIGKLHKNNDYGLETLLFFDDDLNNTYYYIYNNNPYIANVNTYIDDELYHSTSINPYHGLYLTLKIKDILNKKIKRVVFLNDKPHLTNEVFCDENTLSKYRKLYRAVFS